MSVTVSKLEADLQLKTPALKCLEIFSTKIHQLSTISPEIIQNIHIHSGDLGNPGFVIIVNYTLDGKAKVAKEVVEHINLIEHSITFKVIEGDLLEEYKSFKFIIKLTPHLLQGSLVHWTLEYEKLKEDTPLPHSLLDKVLEVSKHIDASLSNLIQL